MRSLQFAQICAAVRSCKEAFEVQACAVWVVYEGSLRRVGSNGIEGATEPTPLLCNDIGNFAGICGHCLSISVGRVIMSNDVEALGGFDPEVTLTHWCCCVTIAANTHSLVVLCYLLIGSA